jgi:1-acyl-sn-glycerol-3-phosphate acyltransferase
MIFPEGSRSPVKGLGRLGRGAAHVALRTGCRMLPVVITCDPPTLKKGQPWYSVPTSRLRYRLSVGTPFTAAQIVGSDLSPPIAARKITAHVRKQFELGLERGIT